MVELTLILKLVIFMEHMEIIEIILLYRMVRIIEHFIVFMDIRPMVVHFIDQIHIIKAIF